MRGYSQIKGRGGGSPQFYVIEYMLYSLDWMYFYIKQNRSRSGYLNNEVCRHRWSVLKGGLIAQKMTEKHEFYFR